MDQLIPSLSAMTYTTPVGTFPTWEAAASACERCDLDPVDCIEIAHCPAPSPFAPPMWELSATGLRPNRLAGFQAPPTLPGMGGFPLSDPLAKMG